MISLDHGGRGIKPLITWSGKIVKIEKKNFHFYIKNAYFLKKKVDHDHGEGVGKPVVMFDHGGGPKMLKIWSHDMWMTPNNVDPYFALELLNCIPSYFNNQYGKPPYSHSASIYGPGLKSTFSPYCWDNDKNLDMLAAPEKSKLKF